MPFEYFYLIYWCSYYIEDMRRLLLSSAAFCGRLALWETMRLSHIFQRRENACVIGILLATVLWNECFALLLKSLFWNVPSPEPGAARFLIVADPQLIGYQDEHWLVGPFARWDSDRYLGRSFQLAMTVLKPDVVVFMGDLMDEGVKMSQKEWAATLSRFQSVYAMAEHVQKIYLPGDNDVGGEYEPVSPKLLERFRTAFPNKFDASRLGLGKISFTETNVMNGEQRNLSPAESNQTFRIVLSHVLVTTSWNAKTQNMLYDLNPDLILSAHDHVAVVYSRRARGDVHFERLTAPDLPNTVRFLSSSRHPRIELQYPTCSYRMGVKDMGFGVVQIGVVEGGKSLNVVSSLIWLPSRFHQLYLYAVVVVLVAICTVIRRVCCRAQKHVIYERLKLF
uniref:Metallophos domain-containing protein n=2 Tax=Steinernema glaseri TaxID=37863 RepID=A0A1I7YJI1_9BILA